jgi:UDP-N-acetylglucosamine 2-epimerase
MDLIALCYGTRPQVIKASVLLESLSARWCVRTVDTGQHYDYELNGLLYAQLGIRPPEVFLEVGSAERDVQLERVRARVTGVLQGAPVRAVVVIGDTNSTLGCARAAVHLGIPVVHVEAGLRAADARMAEEQNRRAVDAVGALLCAPCRRAADNLVAEGVPGRIAITGDVAQDSLRRHASAARLPPELEGLAAGSEPWVLATLHRAELTDNSQFLEAVLRGLSMLGIPVVLPLHPRTRTAVTRLGLQRILAPSIHVLPPLGYLQMMAALLACSGVVTDSGGVQREAYWLGAPCVTARTETEWTETVEAGANVLVPPPEAEARLPEVLLPRLRSRPGAMGQWATDAYGDGHASGRVAQAVQELLDAPRFRPPLPVQPATAPAGEFSPSSESQGFTTSEPAV